MITLIGHAFAIVGRGTLAQWAFIFLVINFIYIPRLEERQLREGFCQEYVAYRRHVHRLLPRMRPWTPAAPAGSR